MAVTITSEEVLACPLDDNDAGARTIREYLVFLLHRVWQEQEGFSGKRPFGTSGWNHDLTSALEARYKISRLGADELITQAIDSMIERKAAVPEVLLGLERRPLTFVLRRSEDVTGVSGTGVVAEGVLWSDGTVNVRWLKRESEGHGSSYGTTVFHDQGLESVEAIHLSHGGTEIVWLG